MKDLAIENRKFKLLLIFLSAFLFLIPVVRFGSKGYTDFFFFNVGYYSLGFVFLYYIGSKIINKFGFNNKSNGLKLVLFIIFEALCIWQFSADSGKLNKSIDNIQTIYAAPSNANIPVPELSDSAGASSFSRGSENLEKLSYALTKVRNSLAANFSEIQKQENNLISELQSNLSPSNLLSSGGVLRAEDTIQKYQLLISKKRNIIDALYKQMNDEIDKLHMSNYDISEYRIGESEGRKNYNNIYDIQEKELTACGYLVTFIKNNFSNIRLENNQFVFDSKPLLQEYNSLTGEIYSLSSKESALISKISNGLDAFRKKLNKAKI